MNNNNNQPNKNPNADEAKKPVNTENSPANKDKPEQAEKAPSQR